MPGIIDGLRPISFVIGLWRISYYVFVLATRLIISALYRAYMRNRKLRPVPPAHLDLPLLASRLSDLPYQVESKEEIAESIATLLVDSNLLHFSDQELMQTNSVWFLAEGRRGSGQPLALFLIFRGTMSPTDAIADVMFRPNEAPNGVMCHGGFLRCLQDDKTLHERLNAHLGARANRYNDMYVMGHSLGGALSQVLAGGGFLPKSFAGKLHIISLGGPVPFYGVPNLELFDRATASASVLSIINANDVVPRLLGCPLSSFRELLKLLASSNNHRKQRELDAVIDTLEKYRGFRGYQLIFLHGGRAFEVPLGSRKYVLHLAEALHVRCIADHLSYVSAVEAAAGAAPWSACRFLSLS